MPDATDYKNTSGKAAKSLASPYTHTVTKTPYDTFECRVREFPYIVYTSSEPETALAGAIRLVQEALDNNTK